MINKFMTVYAGHIDIPDHGQDATPANDRRYSNNQLASVFDKTEAIAKTMDECGYDTCGSPSIISSTKAMNACRTF